MQVRTSVEAERSAATGGTTCLPALDSSGSHSESSARRATVDDKSKARRSKSGPKSAHEDQSAAVKSLVKTYQATTQKLLYVFAQLNEDDKTDSGPKASVNDALQSSARSMMLHEISAALAAGLERVIRSTDLGLRSMVVRDLRARFGAAEQSAKPVTNEQGTQVGGMRSMRSGASSFEASEQMDGGGSKEAGNTDSAVSTAAAASGDENSTTNLKAPHTVAIYDRLKAWEARKQKRVEEERKKREESAREEVAQRKEARRSSVAGQYGHVESVMKLERQREEDQKLATAEKAIEHEVQARTQVEQRLSREEDERSRVEAALREREEELRAAEVQLNSARAQIADADRRYAKLQAEAAAKDDTLEIAECLDGKKFETWPMAPGKRVLRVNPSEEFDGRVSSEYRVKDVEGGERGVSLFMGRSSVTRQPTVQCILFEPKYLSDLEAARWWAANRYRFERSAVLRSSS